MVEFEDGIYYPGTINTDGDSPKDIYHAKGRWGVLFDDCTKDRFHDGATDGEKHFKSLYQVAQRTLPVHGWTKKL